MDRAQFERELSREGYMVKESGMQPRPPGTLHTHEFDARVFVLDGEITITLEDSATTYRKGEAYMLPAGTLHTESVGEAGVTYLAGRRDPV